MDKPIPAFIVNLETAVERRRRILAAVSAYEEIEAEIVSAVDGRNASAAAFAKSVASSRVLFRHCREHSLAPTEIACALSHLRCLRLQVERDIPVALVLEDDVLLKDGFGQIIAGAASFLLSLPCPAVILLSARTRVYGPLLWHGCGGSIRSAFDGAGAYAYLVNRMAASRLIERTLPLVAPFDHWHCHARNGIRLFSLAPHPASFAGVGDDSSIRGQRDEKWRREETWRHGGGRLQWRLARILDGRRVRWALLKRFRGGVEMPKEWPDRTL